MRWCKISDGIGNTRNRIRMFNDSSDSEMEIQRNIDGKNGQ